MTRAALAVLLLATACAPPPPWASATDATRVPWPDICRRDLAADTANVPVFRLPRAQLTAAVPSLPRGTTVNGLFLGHAILVADDLDGWRLADTLHHERCHAVCSQTRAPSCAGHFKP